MTSDKRRCGEICLHSERCKVFMHNSKLKQCKLVAFENPDANDAESDWIFCRKKGNYQSSKHFIQNFWIHA